MLRQEVRELLENDRVAWLFSKQEYSVLHDVIKDLYKEVQRQERQIGKLKAKLDDVKAMHRFTEKKLKEAVNAKNN